VTARVIPPGEPVYALKTDRQIFSDLPAVVSLQHFLFGIASNSGGNYSEAELQLREHQYHFEARIREEFDSITILAYEQLEYEKSSELYHKRLERSVSAKLEELTNLSDAQREIIERAYYSIDLPPESRHAIGLYGTYYGQYIQVSLSRRWYRPELTRLNSSFMRN